MSNAKYLVVTTITHTRNTFVVDLADIGDIDINLGDVLHTDDYINEDDIVCSSVISEDLVGFSIKDYNTTVKYLEKVEGEDVADVFEDSVESE